MLKLSAYIVLDLWQSHRPTPISQQMKNASIFFRFLTSTVFHVKPLQGECSAHTCMGITEPQEVGHKVFKQSQTEEAAGNSFTDISKVQQVGSEGVNSTASVATGRLRTGMTEHKTVRL